MTAHLEDEALSAVLDGEAAPQEAAHARTCADCAARLADLHTAVLLVQAPPPPVPSHRREAAVAAALAQAGTPPLTGGTPLPVHTAPPWWRRVPVLAAAAVVVAAVSVPVVGSLLERGEPGGTTSALDTGGGRESPDQPETGPPPVERSDLGAIGPSTDLDRLIRSALGRDQGATGGPGAQGAAGADLACEVVARAGEPALGSLRYAATATWEDRPAIVYAFDATSGDATSGDATSGDATSGDATSGDATSGDATSGDATSGDALAVRVLAIDGCAPLATAVTSAP